MKQYYLPDRYRALAPAERELQHNAIKWLLRKNIKPNEIAYLSLRNIDFEAQVVSVEREHRFATVRHNLGFSDSPLSEYLKIWGGLKSNRFIFPAIAFTGRNPELCRNIAIEDVIELGGQIKRIRLLTKKAECARLRVSKPKLHFNY